MAGYHFKEIPQGEYGELSKIIEEYHELMDAAEQNNTILILCELADLVGAIEGYTESNYDIGLRDLIKMKDSTKTAFEDGTRIAKRNTPIIRDSAQNKRLDSNIIDPVFDDVSYVPRSISQSVTLNLIALFFYILALVVSGILVLNGVNVAYVLTGLIIGSCVLSIWFHVSSRFCKNLAGSRLISTFKSFWYL